ncbi:MAG: TIGR03564 family F420-dependent LLM class oxidoreductase [Acidimicrobiales bacterium]
MRIGIMVDNNRDLRPVISDARDMDASGIDSLWTTQIFGYDAITLMALLGTVTTAVELGTAVVPIYGRHPLAMAAQARTAQAASQGRFVLGVGLSHQMLVEGMYGLAFERPASYMREYLSALLPLLAGEQVTYEGERVKVSTFGPQEPAGIKPVPVLVAALGKNMLKLAGEMASGTVTWMTGPHAIGSHIVPSIVRSAADAGRPDPRVVVGIPVCVTSDADAARVRAGQTFAMYGLLPSYRAMLDIEGVEEPAGIAVAGSEEDVEQAIARFEDAGATDFVAAPFGSREERARTTALLAHLDL